MLANQKAETVTEAWILILVAVVLGSRSGCLEIELHIGLGFPPKLLNGAEADAVSLAESAIDCSGFGDPHFCTANHRGNVRRICLAIPDEPL
jgi:hypothetical protein